MTRPRYHCYCVPSSFSAALAATRRALTLTPSRGAPSGRPGQTIQSRTEEVNGRHWSPGRAVAGVTAAGHARRPSLFTIGKPIAGSTMLRSLSNIRPLEQGGSNRLTRAGDRLIALSVRRRLAMASGIES
jgi:hypothetical protein